MRINKARSLLKQNLASEEGDEKLIIAFRKILLSDFNTPYTI